MSRLEIVCLLFACGVTGAVLAIALRWSFG